jgi:hypothetical protein
MKLTVRIDSAAHTAGCCANKLPRSCARQGLCQRSQVQLFISAVPSIPSILLLTASFCVVLCVHSLPQNTQGETCDGYFCGPDEYCALDGKSPRKCKKGAVEPVFSCQVCAVQQCASDVSPWSCTCCSILIIAASFHFCVLLSLAVLLLRHWISLRAQRRQPSKVQVSA